MSLYINYIISPGDEIVCLDCNLQTFIVTSAGMFLLFAAQCWSAISSPPHLEVAPGEADHASSTQYLFPLARTYNILPGQLSLSLLTCILTQAGSEGAKATMVCIINLANERNFTAIH